MVLDVRPMPEYEAGHIAGACCVWISELRSRLRELPRSRKIVAYCRGPHCVFADEAVELLSSKGYQAFRLECGFPEWKPSWSWIIAANVLVGINQGFTWSMTVLMKIDLAGPARRGMAMGLNEFAGYGAVGLAAILTGYIAAFAGLRSKPFYLGIGYSIVGFLLSLVLVRETRGHMEHESREVSAAGKVSAHAVKIRFGQVFAVTSWKSKTLFGACQAGLVNNLNDGVAWGIFPLFFAAHGLNVEHIGIIKAVYAFVSAAGQLISGPLSDRWGRKGLIVAGRGYRPSPIR